MTSPFVRAILASCALACAAAPALADSIVAGGSSAGVSASSAGSVSLKGSSNSIEGSSASSSRGDKTAVVQDGTYRVTAGVASAVTAALSGEFGASLAPQGMEGAQAFVLNVPVGAFGGEVPSAGDTLQAQRRDYGVQFARADTPFYLVLADAWSAELDSRPLTQ